MTAAVFGLVGVVVGSVLTAWLNYWLQKQSDDRRWNREDRLRDYERRRQVYTDLLYWSDENSLHRRFLTDPGGARMALSSGFKEAQSEVELLAPPKVAQAAEDLRIAFFRCMPDEEEIEVTEEEVGVVFRAEPYGELWESRDRFRLVAREDLGILSP